MKQAVFFDLYQTLVRYEPPREEIIADALGDFGIEATADMLVQPIVAADEFIYQAMAHRPMGLRSSEERFALYVRHHEILFEKAGLSVPPEITPEVLKKAQAHSSNIVLFDDVVPTLNKLKEQDLILGLISNVDYDMTETLDNLGLTDRLDVVMTSRDADATKPSPAIFHAAMDEAGVTPSQSLYVGDQYDIDIVGSRSAGMTPVLIDRTDFHTDITDVARITSLSEIGAYLDD